MHSHLNFFCVLGFLHSFSQLIQYTLQSPRFTSNPKAVAGVTKLADNTRFWIPHKSEEKYMELSQELDRNPKEPTSSNPYRRLAQSDYDLSNFPVIIPTTVNGGGELPKFNPQRLPDYAPSKRYFLKLSNSNDKDTTISVAHLATLKLWDNPNASHAEFDAWIGVLQYAFMRKSSKHLEVMVSIQYDLNSLMIQFGNNYHLMAKIRLAQDYLSDTYSRFLIDSTYYWWHDTIPWKSEVFALSPRFSKQLEDVRSLSTLIGEDVTFQEMLNPSPNQERRTQELLQGIKKITSEFGTYNSYKRVITLAVCSHAFSNIDQAMRRDLLFHLSTQLILLRNEATLLTSIAKKFGYGEFQHLSIIQATFTHGYRESSR